ncbi:RagB/SusD family nutrient uptake outer membrane protein [Gelidibacter mesophilus]|uniref:RagB/SusD family nutrient uptake outer membrane protein n=1 Tax=Gelidibacter mesophilus TaxID=169050 RepID=UPI000414F2D1|nr:RagB/SusD family nutrient uptake outer membrane protein [Gelidibacter mesophilus]
MKTITKLNFAYIILIINGITLLNCEDFIEIDVPDSQLTGETVFNDISSAEAAVSNIYSELSNNTLVCGNNKGVSILLGSYSDELQTYNTGIPEFVFFQNNLTSFNASVTSIWNGSYNLIYATNAVFERLKSSTAIPINDKERILGEALFTRAFIHFYLNNIFGEIPYITTTNYTINSKVNKSTTPEIYSLLIADLEEAKLLLASKTPSPLKLRPSYNAVKSLLARIHLYHENWEDAKNEANAVINSESLVWIESLESVFSKNSSGTIWQLMRNQEGLPTYEAQSFIFTLAPPPNRALSNVLMDAFEPEDLRKEVWTGHVKSEENIWYYPYKYKQIVTDGESSEYSIMFRIEELYLIRAEAQAHLGELEGARNDINKVRNRASLSNTSAETKHELLNATIKERRIEFFSELGHRFFDLKRTGRFNTTLTPTKQGWDATDILWPLPDSELLLNPNLLPQNAGY